MTEVKGTKVTAVRKTDGKMRSRNMAKFKLLKPRSERFQLRKRKTNQPEEEDSDDEDYINIRDETGDEGPRHNHHIHQQAEEGPAQVPLPHPQMPPATIDGEANPANRPVRSKKKIQRLGIDPEPGPSAPRQLSPRERSRRQGLARRRQKQQGNWKEKSGGWYLWEPGKGGGRRGLGLEGGGEITGLRLRRKLM